MGNGEPPLRAALFVLVKFSVGQVVERFAAIFQMISIQPVKERICLIDPICSAALRIPEGDLPVFSNGYEVGGDPGINDRDLHGRRGQSPKGCPFRIVVDSRQAVTSSFGIEISINGSFVFMSSTEYP